MAAGPASSPRTIGLITFLSALGLYAAFLHLSDQPAPLDLFSAATGKHCGGATAPTDETHIAFAVLGSRRTLVRRPFVEMWWRPNTTRGLIWLYASQAERPWPATLPPYRVFDEAVAVPLQMKRVVEETFLHFPARWLVLGDDDTVFFVDNLVEVLRRYDHEGFFYVGGESESAIQNSRYHGMAFGGGGVALSARLVKALVPILDRCLARYQNSYILDHIVFSCISELGVDLSPERGFHQVDLRGNVTGFLSAHPQAPLVSLHHVELVDPIIQGLTREAAMRRLMAAARADASRMLQQSFCYDRRRNWTLAVSYGYSVHVHERAVEPRWLQVPLHTFRPWRKSSPAFIFDTRRWWREPCSAPHEFYLEGVVESAAEEAVVATRYVRLSGGDMPLCGSHSANGLREITVVTPKLRRQWVGSRRECCEVEDSSNGEDRLRLRVRPCVDGEAIYG